MVHDSLSAGAADAHLSAVDDLIARPFPEQKARPGEAGRWGGPGYHLGVLRESRDFWNDRSEEVVEAVERELEADLAALAKRLTSRWGCPETVDLWPYLGFDGPDRQQPAPEPLVFLCNVAGSMQVWRLPDSDRWLALAIGQADPDFPLQLLAAVGVAAALER
ncbi:hypothetical protein PV721_22385 [Streptomyces sp. MB09-01]|uniref:hypothetical protein n=1 Tax=Streptomyces sp. MB09-01 TaxID=3028666 RepID=UPI0029BC482B|nr:hypothetical protein [Streptomyces sp. MB09-01]MDX3537072.1 hypothetical protein [Streptomyces sp. MB09-01]